VSVLAALAGNGTAIAGAHVAAVHDVVAHFERRLLGLRRPTAPGRLAPAVGLLAAAFDHRINASAEPHLHTHVIICNLGQDADGGWSAIHSGWWTERPALSAIYQMSLRRHLTERGFNLQWRIRDDGFAEVIGVPRAAVRAASSRGRAAAADRTSFGEQSGRTVGIRSTAAARGRSTAADRGSWGAHGVSGFGSEEAARLAQAAPRSAVPALLPGLDKAVAARLAAKGSTFRTADVLVALAACTPGGVAVDAAERWVARFCAAAHPVATGPGRAPRWTTPLALAADERLWACARRIVWRLPPDKDGLRLTVPSLDYPGLAPQALLAARTLVAGAPGIHILQAPAGRTNLLAHGAVLEVAGAVWTAAGQRVAVAVVSDQAAERWRVLTGIERYRTGQVADTVVIDHADRRPTPDLLSLLIDIDRSGARAVLVEGGTRPRLSWRCSAALAHIGDRMGRLDPGPEPAWASDDLRPRLGALPHTEAAWPTATHAVRHLLATWLETSAEPDPPILVGLGYPEVEGLNQAARALLVRRGRIGGPALVIRGRAFQRGDQILALRRLAPALPPGTRLSVVEVDPRHEAARVTGNGQAVVLDRGALAHAGYGYAVTPPLAAHMSSPVIVLGPAEAMGPHRRRVVAAALVHLEASRARDQALSLGMAWS
jgi:hypothetical protein